MREGSGRAEDLGWEMVARVTSAKIEVPMIVAMSLRVVQAVPPADFPPSHQFYLVEPADTTNTNWRETHNRERVMDIDEELVLWV